MLVLMHINAEKQHVGLSIFTFNIADTTTPLDQVSHLEITSIHLGTMNVYYPKSKWYNTNEPGGKH